MNILTCPFCGSNPEGCFHGLGGVNVTAVNCSNRDCIAHCRQVSLEQWNTRADVNGFAEPVEASITKNRLEKLEAFVKRARQESDLVTINAGHPDMHHKVMVPYWFMKDPL